MLFYCEYLFDIKKVLTRKLNGKTISFGHKNIIELIFSIADSICVEIDVNEILLENKITLRIAIRLKTDYLISKLPELDLK